jgi:outer membrane protein TolC
MKRSLFGLLLLSACRTYEAKPLDPREIIERIAAERESAPQGEVLSLARATELMRARNPRLVSARAAHAVEAAVADTPTPLPNPVIEVAPTYLTSGGDRLGVEAALGWSVLLGGRRRLTDDVNAIRAEAAFVDVVAVEREEYLALRRAYAALALATRTTDARRELAAAARASADVMRRLVEAAQATALDVREAELEALLAEAAVLEATEAEEAARSEVAALTGVTAAAFRAGEAPALPDAVPAEEELREVLLRDHPGLARLRAAYAVAEKELRLEIARQYPALDFGPTFELEEGTGKFGLLFGIEIPLFDRNQPGIARADARRDEVRATFEAEATRGLGAVEAALRRLALRRARLELVRTRAAPAAAEALDLARRGLESGAADSLRYLTVLRVERGARLDVLAAERDAYEAWSDLEAACGAPLLRFKEEPE